MSVKGKKIGKKVFILKRRVYFYIVAVILAVFLFLVAIFSFENKNELSFYYSPSENGAVVLSGDKVLRNTVPGKSVARVRYCAEKTSSAVLMSEGSSYTLYSVSGNKAEKIADNCTSDYVMSHSGNEVVYIASDGYLYSQNIKTGKTVTIDESAEKMAISPDGSNILYSKPEGNITKLYLAQNGKSVFLADNYIPLAVSDDATLIYVLSNDNSLYLLGQDGSVKSKLCTAVDTGIFCFSSDISDVVFSDGTYTYISQQGKSRVRLIPGKAVPVFITSEASLCNSSGNVYVYPEKQLTKLIYVNVDGMQNYSLYYINKDMTRTDVASEVVNYTITDNGVIYLKSNGEIYQFKKGESTLVTSGAADMYASSDGRYVYYVTNDYKLYSHKRKTASLIADGMSKMYMAEDDTLYFIMSDGRLYSVKNGNRSDLIDEQVYTCRCSGDAVYYSKNYSRRTGTFELYSMNRFGKFRFVADGLTRI